MSLLHKIQKEMLGDIPAEEYLKQKNVKKILEDVVVSILEKRPESIEKFILDYMSTRLPKEPNTEKFPQYKKNVSADPMSPQEQVFPSKSMASANLSVSTRRRSAISPDVLRKAGQGATRRNAMSSKMTSNTTVEIKTVPKDAATFESLEKTIQQVDLFNFMSDIQRKQLVNAMFPKNYKKGEYIIQQGDPPDNFYIIESGKCSVVITKDNTDTLVSTINPGQYCGELALISGSTRAASVIAMEDTKTWAIDQTTYLSLLKEAHSQKRSMYKSILKSVDLLKNLDDYKILLIADALQPYSPSEGETIITQGETGNDFYLILEGSCDVYKKNLSGQMDLVGTLKQGMYFGERALLTNEPRAATVKAGSSCKLVRLDRASFHRLLSTCKGTFQIGMAKYDEK